MHTHEVEAKTIDVILVNPVFHTRKHVLTHDFLITGSLVTTATTITPRAIGILAIESTWASLLEVSIVNAVGVVVDYVENNADASFVQRLHHLLELAVAGSGVIWIGRVTTLGNVIVQWVITPIVTILVKLSLID